MINIPFNDTNCVLVNDLIALANIEKNNIDTIILQVNLDNTLLIKGKYENINNKFAIACDEIIQIVSSSIIDSNTQITIKRFQFGTKGSLTINGHIRSVILSEIDFNVLDWNFNDTIGNVNGTLFPVELGNGSISLISDLSLWSPHSLKQKFKVKNKKTVAYIFKGIGDVRVLKHTTFVSKVKFNTRGLKEPNKIILDIKSKLSQWYDKDLTLNRQLKGTNPKEFFKLLFGLNDNEIYYADGVDENSFLKINNLHTKEYKTVSELLKAYCSNGVRFCFDRLERIKIFADFKVDNIQPQKILEYDISNSMLTEDDQMIYNTINTQSYQRQTMYNFEDLDNKYVKFFRKKENAINSNEMIKKEENGDYNVLAIEIKDDDVKSHVQITDYVLFKRTVAPYQEFYGKVISMDSSKTIIMPILYDKDRKLIPYGKGEYLYKLLVENSCYMDLYYVKEELPMVFKYTRNKNGEEIDSSLNIPLLPRIDGETKYQNENNITFGCASNLKVGQYTGIIEEIDKIYGVWDNSKLLYNMELDQFSNTNYPPIFVLSNKMEERLVGANHSPIKHYTHFDNSNLEIEISKADDNSSDAKMIMRNTMTINSGIDLYIDKELSRLGNKVLEVRNLQDYHLGDVLIVNKPDDLNSQEEIEFDEMLSSIKWVVTAKTKERQSDGSFKNYIWVDTPFAKRKQKDKVYEFTKFPNWSIVYVQELYFRGNPVIEYAQDVIGYSKGVNIDGDTSREIYGEQKYELDSKQLNKENLRLLMGYILDNFQATNVNNTKFNVPISAINGIDIELLDVISVIDPVFTKIDKNLKWLVIGIESKAKTNVVNLKLLNINTENTKPYKIDIKDIIEYKPVEIPEYSHTGGEGNTEENNDGQGGTAEDSTLGQFWLAEVDPKKFRARVEKFEGNYIYFKDFNGEEVEAYKSKLFPVCEFGVTINGEVLFVQSDQNYRTFIKKRRVYNTQETIISPEDEVTFLTVTTYVDIDGTFYGRKMMMGDGDSYLKVDPITGVKVVGDFQVGESNKNPNNDLWQSMQNNRTFRQEEPPINTVEYTLKNGDIWYDTNDENHVYRYDNERWLSCRDGSIVTSQSQTFIQPDEPIPAVGKPIKENDTWYDSDDGYKPYIYKDGRWVNVSDTSLTETIDRVQANVDKITGELTDIASDSKLTPSEKQTTLKEWEQIKSEYPIILQEAKKFQIDTLFYTDSYNGLDLYLKPLLVNMDTTNDISGEVYRQYFIRYYNRRQEILNNINKKLEDKANQAQEDATTALGNSKIFYQPNEPTEKMKENDLWFDTDDQNHPYIYKGGKWTDARDTSILTDSGARIYYQPTQPTGTPNVPLKNGDIWIDLDEGNIQYIYHNGEWIDIRDDRLIEALNNARVFFQDNAPTSTPNGYQIKQGDIWYDTNDNNHVYIYNQGKWESGQDKLINEALKASRVFQQPNEPSTATETIRKGDLWYDTDDNNHLYIYNGSKWISGKDKSYITDGGNRVYFQNTQPSGTTEKPLLKNDMWIDTDDNNHPYVYNGSSWTSSRDGSILNANNAIYFQNDPPQNTIGKPLREGDLWYDTNDGNKPYVYKNGRWNNAQDEAINNALKNARIFYQPTQPANTPSYTLKENDLWYDTDDNNHPYIYQGGRWVSARDKAFELASGIKVYFQSTQPPTTGKDAKAGNIWFDTAHNNTMYVLINENGILKWVLADDSQDKINTGRIVLNGNTTVQGDFKVRGGNVELNGATKVNGILEVFSNNQGIISYNGVDEASSTQRIVIRGGEILFQEKI